MGICRKRMLAAARREGTQRESRGNREEHMLSPPPILPIVSKEFALESWMSQSRLVVNVSGTADMNTMLAFGEALVQVHEEVTAKSLAEVCLDLHKVYFLNSTCLKNITTLALRAKDTGYRIVCRISARLSWQRRALDPIVRLAQGALVLEETSE